MKSINQDDNPSEHSGHKQFPPQRQILLTDPIGRASVYSLVTFPLLPSL